MTAPAERWSIAPYFIVDDVISTAAWYRDMLGFGYERLWGEPPAFCMVRRSGVVIMLAQLEQVGVMRPNRTVNPEAAAWDAYILVADATAPRDEFASRGVTVVRDLCDQVYGCRDFEIDDWNGYRLCFGQDLNR